MANQMYDAKLSTITNSVTLTTEGSKTVATFILGKEPHTPKQYKRVLQSRYFSNHSVDVVVFKGKRYLLDSLLEVVII